MLYSILTSYIRYLEELHETVLPILTHLQSLIDPNANQSTKKFRKYFLAIWKLLDFVLKVNYLFDKDFKSYQNIDWMMGINTTYNQNKDEAKSVIGDILKNYSIFIAYFGFKILEW